MTLLAPSVILEPDTQYKDATTLLGYVFVVVVVNQLGTQRRIWLQENATSLRVKFTWPQKYNRASCPVPYPRYWI